MGKVTYIDYDLTIRKMIKNDLKGFVERVQLESKRYNGGQSAFRNDLNSSFYDYLLGIYSGKIIRSIEFLSHFDNELASYLDRNNFDVVDYLENYQTLVSDIKNNTGFYGRF